MALPRYAVHASSLVALAGMLSLLLADSASESCEKTPFDRTFDVNTTCDGGHSGRIRITRELYATVGDSSASFAREDVKVVSGSIDVQGGTAIGSCSGEDEPFEVTGLTLTIPADPSDSTTGTGLERAECTINLSTDLGKDIDCTSPDVPIVACSIRLQAIP